MSHFAGLLLDSLSFELQFIRWLSCRSKVYSQQTKSSIRISDVFSSLYLSAAAFLAAGVVYLFRK